MIIYLSLTPEKNHVKSGVLPPKKEMKAVDSLTPLVKVLNCPATTKGTVML